MNTDRTTKYEITEGEMEEWTPKTHDNEEQFLGYLIHTIAALLWQVEGGIENQPHNVRLAYRLAYRNDPT